MKVHSLWKILSCIAIILLLATFAMPLAARGTGPTGPGVDTPHPILSTLAMRQAIAYCTDRSALAKAAYPDLTDPEIEALMMDTFLPKDHWAYHQPTTQYPYDPVQGMVLLASAGWTVPEGEVYRVNAAGDRLALKLTTNYNDLRLAWGELLEAQLLECGIQLLRFPANQDWWFGETFSGLGRRDFEIAGYAWLYDAGGGFEEPYGLFGCDQVPTPENGWSGLNRMGWCNPVASEAAEQASNLDLTQAERLPFFATLQEEFAADMPSLPLFDRADADGYEHLDFNFSTPPPPPRFLRERDVRRAIAFCTDRFALTKAAFPALSDAEIQAKLTDTFLPKDHWAYHQPSLVYPYDPVTGRALLESAGWTVPEGETYRTDGAGERLAVVLTTTNREDRYAWGELFEQQMLACGILVARFHTDSDWFLYHGLPRRDFKLGAFGWLNGEEDPVSGLYTCDQIPTAENGWSGLNYMGWCNRVASAAAQQTGNLDLTRAERKPYFVTLQEEFAKDLPSLVLYTTPSDTGFNFEHIDFYMAYMPEGLFLPLIGN